MGRPRIKNIDDAQTEVKVKTSKKKLDVGSEKMDKEVGSSKLADQTSNIQPQNLSSNLQHPTSKNTKPGKAKPRSKKYQEAVKDLDRTKTYSLAEAVDMAKKLSYSKFNATLEAHINTAQTGIRGSVSLPFVAGKTEYEHSPKQVYKTEAKAPVIHLALGKLNQPNEELIANIKTLYQTIGKSRVKKISLSPTMGPGIKVSLTSI